MHIDEHGKVNFEAPPKPRYGPPAGWVQPTYEHLNVAQEWARLVARGLQFEPYHGPSQLRQVRGDCLEPLIVAGKHALKVRPLAPDEQLIDGGLYCIAWNDDAEIQMYRDRIGVPRTEKIVIAKCLRYFAGDWYCVCKDSFAELNGIVVAMVVGVVSAVGCTSSAPEIVHARAPVCGNPFDAESSECAQLGLNAATTTIVNLLTGPAALTPSAAVGLNAITVGPFSFATALVCTATGGWSVTTGANAETSNVAIGVDGIGTSAIATNFQWNPKSNLPASTTISGNIVAESTLALAAGATTTIYTWVTMGGVNFPATTSAVVTNLVTKVEVIKR